MRGKFTLLQIGALIGATALCLLALILAVQATATHLKYQDGIETTGTVTDRKVDDSLNGELEQTPTAYRIEVRFTDQDGVEHTRWASNVANPDQLTPGDETTVRYDPDDVGWLAVGESTASGYWLSAGVLFLLALILLIYALHKVRRQGGAA